jgi:hypothetical protein
VMRRVTMADAAQVLGISKEAVRKRIKRGTLRSEMGEDGRRYVYLDSGGDAGPDAKHAGDDHARSVDPRDYLIATLKEQLDAERNAHAETRRIAYTLAQRLPEIEAPREPRESPETGSEDPANRTPEEPFTREETQDEPTSQRRERGWLWRIFIGGD